MPEQVLGKRIRELREEKGWTRVQLGVYAGVSTATVSLAESGRRTPNAETLVKLARALEVEPGALFAEEPAVPLAEAPPWSPSETTGAGLKEGDADAAPYFVRGGRLRALREEYLLSPDELSERSGVSPRSIRNLETGNWSTDGGAVRRLAGALNVDYRQLIDPGTLPVPRRVSAELLESVRALHPIEVRYLMIGLWPGEEWLPIPEHYTGTMRWAKVVCNQWGATPDEMREALIRISPLEARRLTTASDKDFKEAVEAYSFMQRAATGAGILTEEEKNRSIAAFVGAA